MKRDWKGFFKTLLKKSVKSSLIAMTLVPVFFFFLNPHVTKENYLSDLWQSCRVGLEISVIILFLYSSFYTALFLWKPSLLQKFKKTLSLRLALGLVMMVIALAISSYLEFLQHKTPFNIQGMSVGFLIGTITYIGFLVFSAYKETQVSNLKLQVESAEAHMNVLKNQMQPHFLFNSLNSLAELIDSNQDHASQMTQKLSDLYREILESSKSQKTTLKHELAIVEKYLQLETLRFGPRLSYLLEVKVRTEEVLLPSLLMQTLVENSVKHGISHLLDGGVIKVKVEAINDGYQFEISNSASGMKSQAAGGGTGLSNTIERLNLLYADKHNFRIELSDEAATVSFWITGV